MIGYFFTETQTLYMNIMLCYGYHAYLRKGGAIWVSETSYAFLAQGFM